MTGHHIVSTFKMLDCPYKFLDKGENIETFLDVSIRNAELIPLKFCNHNFDPVGYSCCYLLAESHISIHTWPELNALNLDVFVCNFLTENTEKAKTLYVYMKQFFKPRIIELKEIER